MGKVLLGCSGWSYKEWEDIFYPKDEKGKLSFYSSYFTTAEIDSTFYSYPKKGIVYGWNKATPKGFKFSAKLPQIITHEKLLKLEEGVIEDLVSFLDLMDILKKQKKLGALLIQLPPSFKKDIRTLESFLSYLPEGYEFACEFRHLSWFEDNLAFSTLENYNVAYVIVDEPLLPPEVKITSNFSFIRWHGKGKRPWYNYRYKIEELKPWVKVLEEVKSKVNHLYGYFNNHFHGYAVVNCLQMLQLIGEINDRQREMLDKALLRLKRPKQQIELFDFDLSKLNLQDLLLLFIDEGRLKRALDVKEPVISKFTDEIKANVGDYNIIISLKEKRIFHDCEDWRKRKDSKLFCKHLARLFLTLGEENKSIVEEIARDKNNWKFE
jgi:uncharacterized protein YecE (DUF72 family)